jgi:membrane protein
MAMTIRAMDKCYDLEKPRAFYRVRSLAIFLTFVVATLLLIVVVALPIASSLRSYVQNFLTNMGIHVPTWALLAFEVVRYAIGLICMFLALSVIYYFGPCIRQRFRVLTPGAVFCVVVWLLLGAVFRLYVNTVGKTGYERTYGPVGGVVILLLFFYLDAVVLLIGAELNSEIDFIAYNVKPGCTDFHGRPWDHEKLSSALETESASTG